MNELTPEQLNAVTSPAKYIKIIAGPGTGKTHTMVARVKSWIATGVPPEKIAAITFSRRGARELTERCDPRPGFVGTIHSLCSDIIHHNNPRRGALVVVGANAEQESLGKAASLFNVSAKSVKEFATTPASELRQGASTKGKRAALWHRSNLWQTGCTSYDLLLADGVEEAMSGESCRYSHIILDEAQDSGSPDWRLVQTMRNRTNGCLCVVGDPAQTLYRFRGANPEELMNFRATTEVRLTKSFRCPKAVCDFSNTIRSRLLHDGSAIVPANNDPGQPVAMLGDVEIDVLKRWWGGSGTKCVLAATNREAGLLRRILGVPEPADWKASLDGVVTVAQAAMAAHPKWKSIPVVACTFGVEPAAPETVYDWTLETLKGSSSQLAEPLAELRHLRSSVGWVREFSQWSPPAMLDKHVGTVHSAKGGEWDHVWFFGKHDVEDKMTSDELHRLYVAATRAKSTLTLSYTPPPAGEVTHGF